MKRGCLESKVEVSTMRTITSLICLVAIFLLIGSKGDRESLTEGTTVSAAGQDVGYVDRRVTTLEQRLYTIESRLRSVEQQSMSARSTPSAPVSRDPELDRLRGEIET